MLHPVARAPDEASGLDELHVLTWRLLGSMKHTGESVVRIEAAALTALAERIAGPMAVAFQRAVDLMFCCAGRVVVTGMGKSGLIARKIAATLSSPGSPAPLVANSPYGRQG